MFKRLSEGPRPQTCRSLRFWRVRGRKHVLFQCVLGNRERASPFSYGSEKIERLLATLRKFDRVLRTSL